MRMQRGYFGGALAALALILATAGSAAWAGGASAAGANSHIPVSTTSAPIDIADIRLLRCMTFSEPSCDLVQMTHAQIISSKRAVCNERRDRGTDGRRPLTTVPGPR